MEAINAEKARGFLICPRCRRNLSASASTGYSALLLLSLPGQMRLPLQCSNGKFAIRRRNQEIYPHPGIVDLYKQISNVNYFNKNKGKRDDLERMKEQLSQANNDLQRPASSYGT